MEKIKTFDDYIEKRFSYWRAGAREKYVDPRETGQFKLRDVPITHNGSTFQSNIIFNSMSLDRYLANVDFLNSLGDVAETLTPANLARRVKSFHDIRFV